MDKRWSKESVLQSLVQFVKIHKRYPDHNDFETNPELPNAVAVYSLLNSTWLMALKKRCEEEGIPLASINTIWTRESVLEAIDEFVTQNKRFPKISELRRKNGLPSKTSVQKVLGPGWREALCRQYGFIEPKKNLTWDELLSRVDSFRAIHGRIPRIEEYTRKNNLPTQSEMNTLFGPDWAMRLKKHYGIRIPTSWSEKLIVKRVEEFMRRTGEFPSKGDFKDDATLPVIGTLYKFYDDYDNAKRVILDAIKKQK